MLCFSGKECSEFPKKVLVLIGILNDVIVGVKAEGLKRFIVRIAMFKIIHELEIRWTGKVGT